MRTTLDLPESLIKEAMALTHTNKDRFNMVLHSRKWVSGLERMFLTQCDDPQTDRSGGKNRNLDKEGWYK